MSRKVVVIGAGVVGLTVALRLQEEGFSVEIIAEYTPDDMDDRPVEYCSMWAGAHHVSFASETEKEQLLYDRETLAWMLQQLEANPNVPFMKVRQTMYDTAETGNGPAVWSTFMPNFRTLESEELPEGISNGVTFDTITIDTPAYLRYLFKQFQDNRGKLVRRKLKRLSSAIDEGEPPLGVFNCSGLGARELIEDKAMFPTRGQTLIVRAPWVKVGMNRRSPDGPTFIIPRSSGLVVLGGTQLAHDADTSVRPETTAQIGQRCVDLMPELLPPEKRSGRNWKDLDIVSENVGLRPSREGGVRVHAEVATTRHGVATLLIHCYGHGGAGFQSSRGSAVATVDKFKRALEIRAQKAREASVRGPHPADR